MKIKHTNVRLSLFVIAAALIFGIGINQVNAEIIFFQKIVESKNFLNVDNGHYKNLNKDEFIQIGDIKLNQNEQLSFESLHIQREDFKKIADRPNLKHRRGDSILVKHTGIIILTIKYPDFETPVTLYYNKTTNSLGQNTKNQWSSNNGDTFLGGVFPIYGPADINIKVQPYALQLNTWNTAPWGTQYPKQHWRMSFKKTVPSFFQQKTQLQALVLPKNTKNTRLVVESSEDLVNWKLDTPGPKTTTNRERFFRLRAVKE